LRILKILHENVLHELNQTRLTTNTAPQKAKEEVVQKEAELLEWKKKCEEMEQKLSMNS